MTALEERPRSRRQERALLRGERDGSGPVREGVEIGPHPGATGALGLLGEVLVTGLLIAVVGLAVITLPAGLAAGVRHLRRCAAAEDSRLQLFWRDVRSALLPGSAVGAVALVLTLVLVLDIELAGSGMLPGGPVIAAIGYVGLAVVAALLLLAAGSWSPERGWREAFREIPSRILADAVGALYLVATAIFVGVTTWALLLLFVPAIGCAALAVVAVPARPRRPSA